MSKAYKQEKVCSPDNSSATIITTRTRYMSTMEQAMVIINSGLSFNQDRVAPSLCCKPRGRLGRILHHIKQKWESGRERVWSDYDVSSNFWAVNVAVQSVNFRTNVTTQDWRHDPISTTTSTSASTLKYTSSSYFNDKSPSSLTFFLAEALEGKTQSVFMGID